MKRSCVVVAAVGGGAVAGVSPVLGDVNRDGPLHVHDVGPFAPALANPVAFATQFPTCEITRPDLIDRVLPSEGDDAAIAGVGRDVLAICRQFPLILH